MRARTIGFSANEWQRFLPIVFQSIFATPRAPHLNFNVLMPIALRRLNFNIYSNAGLIIPCGIGEKQVIT